MKKALMGGLVLLIALFFSGCFLFENEVPEACNRGELVCQSQSIAYSAVDMILAGKQFLLGKQDTYCWNTQLFIADYSEGGFTTMAAGRENPANPLFNLPDELFKPPYDTTIPSLFDGEHNVDEIRASYSNNGVGKPSEIFKEKLFTDLVNDPSEVSKALKDNDLYNTWIPDQNTFPLFMFHSSTDETVPVENSRTAKACYDAHNSGEQVFNHELATGNHIQSHLPLYILAYLWMATFKE
ncbi:MAG TPA: lipase family protein [Thermotogota bacterium]|nr:lipase family protein [Thermotogota bacterium]HRW34207.1 lipase family protein [Thermotogota bacterium]